VSDSWLERTATLAIPESGMLRLAVVADTHSHPHPKLDAHLSSLRPDAILHAGDIGDLGVLASLRAIAPLFAIRGNIDVRGPDLPDQLIVDLVSGTRTALRLMLVHIGLRGVRLHSSVARAAREHSASLVVCGHSHIPFIARERALTVFNPGSCGPRRFQLPIVFGQIRLDANGLSLSHVDCETGEGWSPSVTPAGAVR
jgi:putative phosphoesterase